MLASFIHPFVAYQRLVGSVVYSPDNVRYVHISVNGSDALWFANRVARENMDAGTQTGYTRGFRVGGLETSSQL